MASQDFPTHQVTLDLRSLCDVLGGIATKWFKIGIQLGIPHNKLLEFQGSPDPLSAVIDYWLRGNVVSPISWDTIVTALKSKYVSEPGLAEEISKDYCRQEISKESGLAAFVEKSYQQEHDKAIDNSSTSSSQASTPNPQSTMDPDMRLDLEFILEKNLKDIISKYASYVDTLRIAVKEKRISTDDLRSYLLSLSATTSNNRKGQKLALLSDKKAQLQQCNTVTNIFDLLTTECTSFLNYDIFQSIMKRYNIADDKEELKYSEHLKAYIKKHKISEFTKVNPLLKSKKDSKELTLKYDIETTCSLAKLEELRKLIAEIMEISPSALEIIDIEEGCVIATFFLPISVADALFTPDTVFTPQQEEKLRAASVLWLKCNGHAFHFEQQNLQNDVLHKLKEQLTCTICLGTYTDPKLLQCQHAYCQQCLMGLVQQDQQGQPTLTCPTCRQVTPVPASGVAGIQADFRTNQLLEIFGKDKKASDLAKFQLLSSEFTLEELPMCEISSAHCPDHDKTLMEIYCGTCKEAICWKCSRSKHQGHFCEALDEAFARCYQDLLSLSKAIVSALTVIDTLCSEISDQRIALEEEIHCTITIDDRKTELISQLHQLAQTKLKNLAAQRDQLETVQAQLHVQRENFKKDTNNKGETLQRKSTTVKRVQKLTTTFQTYLLEPNTEADMIYLPPTIVTDHGIVCSRKSLDISKHCSISKCAGIAIVGRTSTTTLQIRCPIEINLSCELVSEMTGIKVRGSIKRTGHSQYKISYQPTTKGRHQLQIKVNGQYIRGSSFLITARSPVETLHSPILAISPVKGPQGIAVNQRGEILVAEMSADCVTVFSPKGEKLRSFGTSGSGQGQFQTPYDIALDGDENILVTDHRNYRIQKFSPQGEFLTTRDIGPLELPFGITFNASNNKVYMVDTSCQIQVLNSDLSYLYTFGKKGSGKGEFISPRHIACDSTGNLYVTDYKNHRIQVFTPEGEYLRMFEGIYASKSQPFGVAIDFRDRVYASDYEHHSVCVYTDEGQFITSFGSSGSEQGHFRWPSGLAVDDSGVVYVCDLGNSHIQLF